MARLAWLAVTLLLLAQPRRMARLAWLAHLARLAEAILIAQSSGLRRPARLAHLTWLAVMILLTHPARLTHARLPHLTRLTQSLLLAHTAWLPDPARLPCSSLLCVNSGSKGQRPHDGCARGKRLQVNAAGLYRHLVAPLCCQVHSVGTVVGHMEDNG
jgi:hypothetical protein